MQLFNGDCLEVLKTIPNNSIDLIVTDPPYLIENTNPGNDSELSKSISHMNKQLADGIFTEGIENKLLEEFLRVLKTPNIYIWCNHKQLPQYLDFFVTQNKCKFDILIWNKTNALPLYNNKYLTDKEYCLYFRRGGYCNPETYDEAKTVYYTPINQKDKELYDHPTIKPLSIIKNLVKNSSKENDVVLDCFMGSGTTGVACKQLNRNFIGIEIDKKYFEIAKNRIEGTTNKPKDVGLFDFLEQENI